MTKFGVRSWTYSILFLNKIHLNRPIQSPLWGEKQLKTELALTKFWNLGDPVPSALLIRTKFGMQECNHGVLFSPNFALIVIYCWPCDAKNCLSTMISGQIFNFGAPFPHHRRQSGLNLVCSSRLVVYTYVPDFIWSGLLCQTQLQTFPYPMVAPKSFPYSDALMAKWHSHTLPFRSVMDKNQKQEIIIPSPSVDISWAMMIVWRIRGNIIRTVLCCVMYDSLYSKIVGQRSHPSAHGVKFGTVASTFGRLLHAIFHPISATSCPYRAKTSKSSV